MNFVSLPAFIRRIYFYNFYNKFPAMTVNETLYFSGWMKSFEKAEEKGDFRKMRQILFRIRLSEKSIEDIIVSRKTAINQP